MYFIATYTRRYDVTSVVPKKGRITDGWLLRTDVRINLKCFSLSFFFFWKRGDDVSVTLQNELFALDE